MRLNFVFARRARVQAEGSTWTEYRRLRGEPNKERWSGEKKKPKGSEPLLFSPPSPASFDTYHAPRLERLGKVLLMCLS